jgi:hypothetical protein
LNPMNAQERLSNARARIADGNYEEALRDLIWFHNNALSETRAWAGVRLSYAIYDWIRLGELYPPAMAALENSRDDKAQGLLAGRLDRSAFYDVASINERLQTTGKTYELYRQLMTVQPELAQSCAQYALPAVVAGKDYRLAARLIPEPEVEVKRLCARLIRDVQRIKLCAYTRAPRRWVYITRYLEDVKLLLSVLEGIGGHAGAASIKALAIALIPDPSLRREVKNGFVRMSRAPLLLKMPRTRARKR